MVKGDVVYIHNGILLSHKNEQNFAICSNMMGLEGIIISKISETEKDKYYVLSLMSGI